MVNKDKYVIPKPMLNKKEEESLALLTRKYEKMSSVSMLSKTGKKLEKAIPKPIKKVADDVKMSITEAELYRTCVKEVAKGFHVLEKNASKLTISKKSIIERINTATEPNDITCMQEICLVRGYEIQKLVSKYRNQDLLLALTEGGTTGAFGFVGLPFNLVFSTFLFYRAVQSIAMFYGYDVKNNPAELMIAGEVFMNALSPGTAGSNEMSSAIAKVMVMTEVTAVKQTSKKTWEEMAKRGGVTLLLTQMRALANKSAQKALEKTAQKGLEESVFKSVFEQIGKSLTKKAIGKTIPIVGAVIGGLFDVAQMNTVLEYADIFYHKRYLLEKEVRIHTLIGEDPDEIVDVDPDSVVGL